MILGIDCSATPSGGGKRHLIELLNNFDPKIHGFESIIIWGNNIFLDSIPNRPWLIKKSHFCLNRKYFFKLFWFLYFRDRMFQNQFNVLFSPFGTYYGTITPFVSMSRNMLIFDKKERNRFFFSFTWIKLNILEFVQSNSFRKASGIIFISEYAKNTISKQIELRSKKLKVVNHGVSSDFIKFPSEQFSIKSYTVDNPYKILFVSSIWIYKHPINLVRAIEILNCKGYPIQLNIVGDKAQKELCKELNTEINRVNSRGTIINWYSNVGGEIVSQFYLDNHLFVFPSTCENMPNILIEAMASGIPICCSNYPPMPEFLLDGGEYFDPLDVNDLAQAIEKMILNAENRNILANKSYSYSKKFSWVKCTNETFSFLLEVANNN